MTGPTPNVSLLRQTLAYIEAHPEEWNQTNWRCGSTACFAGHAAMLDGGQWEDEFSDDLLARDDDPEASVWKSQGGPPVISVERRARRILGLTGADAGDLFFGYNDLDDLRAWVDAITGGAS